MKQKNLDTYNRCNNEVTNKQITIMMTLEDYIDYYEIDIEATEAMDYLVELINEDLEIAVQEQDYKEAHRLQEIIEEYLT